MKKLLIAMAVVTVSVTAFAAIPTFDSFDTNSFAVDATANSIKPNTNSANAKALATKGDIAGKANLSTKGIVTLSTGTNRVSLATFSTNNPPSLTYLSDDGSSAAIYVKPSEWSDGSYFTIRSSNGSDTNRVAWRIVQ